MIRVESCPWSLKQTNKLNKLHFTFISLFFILFFTDVCLAYCSEITKKSYNFFVIFLIFFSGVLCKSHFEHFSYIFRIYRIYLEVSDLWINRCTDRFNFNLHHIFMFWKLYIFICIIYIYIYIFFFYYFLRQGIWLMVFKIKTKKHINWLFIKNI